MGEKGSISHIKTEGYLVQSLIDMEGKPSYLNIDISGGFSPTEVLLTRSEKEILNDYPHTIQ